MVHAQTTKIYIIGLPSYHTFLFSARTYVLALFNISYNTCSISLIFNESFYHSSAKYIAEVQINYKHQQQLIQWHLQQNLKRGYPTQSSSSSEQEESMERSYTTDPFKKMFSSTKQQMDLPSNKHGSYKYLKHSQMSLSDLQVCN